MRRNFSATTRSGNVYTLKDGVVTFRGEAFKVVSMKVIDRDGHFYDSFEDLPEADFPVVGKSLYFDGLRRWRLTTDIVHVEELL
jgi:hypothetical protein